MTKVARGVRESRAAASMPLAAESMRAYALAILSQVLLEGGRTSEALEATSEALRLRDARGSLEEGESAVFLAHAEALRRAGQLEEAARVAARGKAQVLERASKLDRSDWREAFESIPENAKLLAFSM